MCGVCWYIKQIKEKPSLLEQLLFSPFSPFFFVFFYRKSNSKRKFTKINPNHVREKSFNAKVKYDRAK